MIRSQNNPQHQQIDHGEKGIERRTRQKTLNAAVVADALENISREFGIKKRDRKPQEFGQKIR